MLYYNNKQIRTVYQVPTAEKNRDKKELSKLSDIIENELQELREEVENASSKEELQRLNDQIYTLMNELFVYNKTIEQIKKEQERTREDVEKTKEEFSKQTDYIIEEILKRKQQREAKPNPIVYPSHSYYTGPISEEKPEDYNFHCGPMDEKKEETIFYPVLDSSPMDLPRQITIKVDYTNTIKTRRIYPMLRCVRDAKHGKIRYCKRKKVKLIDYDNLSGNNDT